MLRGRDGRVLLDLNPAVFVSSSVVIGALVFAGVVYREEFGGGAEAVQAWIADRTGWFLVLTVNVVLAYSLYLLCSRFGRVRISAVRLGSRCCSRRAWASD